MAQSENRAVGIQAFKSSDYSKATQMLKRAVKEDPGDDASWYFLGSSYLKIGKNKEAIKALEMAVAISPEQHNYLIGLAYAYMLMGQKKAESVADKALLVNPKSADAHFIIGKAALLRGNYETAYERANRAIDLNPDHTTAYRLKGEALLGRFSMHRGNVIEPLSARLAILTEAAAVFEKFLSLVKDDTERAVLKERIDDMRTFALYFGKAGNIALLDDDPSNDSKITSPKIIEKPRPSYTDIARQNSVQGTVELLVVLKSDGKIGSILVVKGLGGGLSDEAVRAANKIKFIPASLDGVPTSVVRKFEYVFSIR